MAAIFWAPVLLKSTVLGAEELTSKVPAIMVKPPAIPNTALAANCNDVPLMVALKRLAIPLKLDVPVKVAVPAVADRLPDIIRPEAIEKLTAVVTEPVMESTLKFLVPAPEMVFEMPLMVIVPVSAERLPLTDTLPLRVNDAAVLTAPLT